MEKIRLTQNAGGKCEANLDANASKAVTVLE